MGLICHFLFLVLVVADTSDGACSGDARATKADSCPKCGWRIHEPATPGQYTLMRKYETVQEMRDGWTCYMGATAYPDPTKLYTQQMFRERFGRGYFWNTGEPPVHSESGINEQMPWLADPTAGMQRYDKGCEYINDLLVPREDGKPGFSLKAMRPSTLGGYSFDFTDEVTGETDYASANEAYVLRLESNDVVNGGLTVIDVDYLPWGAGVWPAFWMVGSEPNDWLQHPPKNPGLGLRNYWPYRGEIDIIEYINAYTVEQQGHEFRNHVTLHTSCGCMSNRSSPSGRGDLSGGEDDCCAGDAFTGCQASMGPNTVGHPGFRGAIYVCDWIKDSHVDCWFFNKDERGTYAEPGEFEFPDSNWAVRPYHPAEAWLTIVLEFEDGRVEDEKTFVLYEVPSGESPDSQLYSQSQWVSTFGTCTTTPPSNTCSAKYGSTYNSGWKDRMLPFGDYSFRIHTTSGDDEWQPKWNLHAHPDDPGLSDDPPYTLTVDRGGEYV
jgi:hypothetical protein